MADSRSDCSISTACGTVGDGAVAPDRPDLRWASKVRASAAFCLVGIMAGTGLYFSNLAYVRSAGHPGPSSGEASTTPAAATSGWQLGAYSLYATQEVGAAA